MTVKDLVKGLGSVIVKGGKAIGRAIVNASFMNLVKAGVFVGASVVTVAMTIKYYYNRRKAYNAATGEDNKSEEKKTTVDRALQLNYKDFQNQVKLDPVMKKVKKELTKDTNKKLKKKIKKINYADYQKALDKVRLKDKHDDVFTEFEEFERQFAADPEKKRYRSGVDYDDFSQTDEFCRMWRSQIFGVN